MVCLISRQEAARRFGVSMRTISRIEAGGNGPPRVTLRGRILYREADLARWIAARVMPVSKQSKA